MVERARKGQPPCLLGDLQEMPNNTFTYISLELCGMATLATKEAVEYSILVGHVRGGMGVVCGVDN